MLHYFPKCCSMWVCIPIGTELDFLLPAFFRAVIQVCMKWHFTEILTCFSNYQWDWTSSHIFSDYSCFSFCEVKWSRSVVSNSVTSWTVAYQAPLSIGFSRQEYWSGLPFPFPVTDIVVNINGLIWQHFLFLYFWPFFLSYSYFSSFSSWDIISEM